MQSGIESLVKLAGVVSLVLAGLAVWLVPKTRLLKKRQISERLFIATQVIGLACGVLGLVLIFAWPQQTFEWHLWELTAMVYALIYCYWIIIGRSARNRDVVDEKQIFDMTKAGNVTLGLDCLAMFVAFDLHGRGLFDARMFFPYFVLVTILFLSATTLLFFKRG